MRKCLEYCQLTSQIALSFCHDFVTAYGLSGDVTVSPFVEPNFVDQLQDSSVDGTIFATPQKLLTRSSPVIFKSRLSIIGFARFEPYEQDLQCSWSLDCPSVPIVAFTYSFQNLVHLLVSLMQTILIYTSLLYPKCVAGDIYFSDAVNSS